MVLRHAWPAIAQRVDQVIDTVAVAVPKVAECHCRLIAAAKGRVLEIGFGSGLNAPFYDASQIEHLYALEPNEQIRKLARKRVSSLGFNLEWLDLPGEEIPLADESVNTVLVTFSLCTIVGVEKALAGMRRVLKPDGKLVFLEHGAAPDASVRRWQNRLNPIWKRIGGGCNLNLPIPSLLEQAGLKIRKMDTMYLPGWKPVTFNYWGTAGSA